MRNPFIYGEVVTGNDFADRKDEITSLLQAYKKIHRLKQQANNAPLQALTNKPSDLKNSGLDESSPYIKRKSPEKRLDLIYQARILIIRL